MPCVCSLTLRGVTELKLGGHVLGTKWGNPVTKTECWRHRPILRHLSSFPRLLLTGEDKLQLLWKRNPTLNISISTSFLQVRGDKLTCGIVTKTYIWLPIAQKANTQEKSFEWKGI